MLEGGVGEEGLVGVEDGARLTSERERFRVAGLAVGPDVPHGHFHPGTGCRGIWRPGEQLQFARENGEGLIVAVGLAVSNSYASRYASEWL